MKPRIAVILRTTDRENAKVRPEWFNKRSCVLSLIDAVANYDGKITLDIVADGGLPQGVEDALPGWVQVTKFGGGNNRRSFAAAMQCAKVRTTEGADLVVFCEDDYVYKPESFLELGRLHAAAPDAYLALYTPDDAGWHATHRSQPLRGLPDDPRPVPLRAKRITHPTSSYATPGAAFEVDAAAIRLAMYAGPPFAHSTASLVQGIPPFAWRHILSDLNMRRGPRSVLKGAWRVPMRCVLNIVAVFQRRYNRRYLAPSTDFITHVETAHLSPGSEWRDISASYSSSGAKEGE